MENFCKNFSQKLSILARNKRFFSRRVPGGVHRCRLAELSSSSTVQSPKSLRLGGGEILLVESEVWTRLKHANHAPIILRGAGLAGVGPRAERVPEVRS